MSKTNEYPKLPKVFKDKWIEALRSGKYKQGDGMLYTSFTEQYCCLGVACAIQGNNLDELDEKELIDNNINVSNVPEAIKGSTMKHSGQYNKLVEVLTDMNDGNFMPQKSFKQIADWIEKNL